MEFHELLIGAGYGFCGEESDPASLVPCFVFETETVNAAAAYFRAMFVEVGLRQRKDGGLAFCLDVPDHEVRPWAIPINPPDLPKLEAQARIACGCLTFVRATDGTVIDLTEFSLNLEQDWSGRVPRALMLLAKGSVDDAKAVLEEVAAERPDVLPSAHHLLGRCYRAKG